VKVKVEVKVEVGRGHLPFTVHQSRLVSRRLVGRTSNRATPLPHVITRSEKKKKKQRRIQTDWPLIMISHTSREC